MQFSRDVFRLTVSGLSAISMRSQRPVKFFLAGALLILSCLPNFAQDFNQEEIIRVRTDLVTVPVTVLDSKRRRIGGLTQDDFVIRDDGRNAKADHFSVGTDRVSIVFLLDTSGSAHDYLSKQRDAALALFSRFGPGSQVAVIHFSDRSEVRVPFTNEIITARGGFDFPAVGGRHTAIFDSAAAAVHLLEQRQNDPTERRIIILTSDGLDNASAKNAAEVITLARNAATSFYIIHFPLFAPQEGHLAIRPPSKGFRDLAEKTGGRYFTAGNVRSALEPNSQYDLSTLFKAIEDDLASQYVLGFYPDRSASASGSHRIEVDLRKKPRGYQVKSVRQGYNLNH
jgi:Ca-activated chloride channel family protein